MSVLNILDFGGINTKASPLLSKAGTLLTCVNMDTDPIGGKTKRPGIEKLLDNPDSAQVNNLFQWEAENSSPNILYRVSGTKVYYHNLNSPGTAWNVCGNGTISGGGRFGHAVLDNTLIGGNGVGSTRHTTNGTSFTNTPLAPFGKYFAEEFGRVYIGGTASDLFWSTANDPTNWSTAGTADSSSIKIPGAGKINSLFSQYGRIHVGKTGRSLHRWDTYARDKVPTRNPPSSHWSLAGVDDLVFFANRNGIFVQDAVKPTLISAAVEKQFYNRSDTGIAGTLFDDIAGGEFRENYYLSAGSITDPTTGYQLDRAVIRYDYYKNEWVNYQFPTLPTAWGQYVDTSGKLWQIFGDSTGQVYRVNPTVSTDDGEAIEAYLEGVSHLEHPERDKSIGFIHVFANPGCQAKVQVCMGDNLNESTRKWIDIGDLKPGYTRLEMPKDQNRGKFLFFRIYESSKDQAFTIYGIVVEFELEG